MQGFNIPPTTKSDYLIWNLCIFRIKLSPSRRLTLLAYGIDLKRRPINTFARSRVRKK